MIATLHMKAGRWPTLALRQATQRRLSDSVRSEFRHNQATGEWVVFSAARRNRPQQHKAYRESMKVSKLLPHDQTCPFCRGNEHHTPPALLTEYEEARSDVWTLRVVPNKYPAVSSAAAEASFHQLQRHNFSNRETSFHVERIDALGFHEVLVETPAHNMPTALASAHHVERLVHSLRERGRAMIEADPSLRHIMYFKNSGLKAGASLLHPHSQILGLPIVPNEVTRRQRHAREWYLRFQRNVFQHTIEEAERQRGAGGKHRIVLENEHFLCFVPYAALSPFSLWIVPRARQAHFHEASDETCNAFARTLRLALRCLHFGLDEPDFNMVIRSAALELGGREIYRSDLFFRWYCIVVPRLGVGAMGGFEFSTGIQSNSSFPEEDAAFLRSLGPPEEL